MLAHLVGVGDKGALQGAVLVAGEEVGELALAHLADGVVDGLELVLDKGIVGLDVVDRGNDLLGLVVPVLKDEPARRLGQLEDEGQDGDAEEDLESEREPPGDGSGGVRQAVVDPVRNHDTTSNQCTLDHNKTAAVVAGADLGLPSRDSGGVHAIANTTDDTTNDEHGKSNSSSLDGGADSHNGSTEEDDATATQRVTDEYSDDSSEEATQVVRGHGNTLIFTPGSGAEVGIRVIGVDSREILEEDGEGENTTHNTLICVSPHVSVVRAVTEEP